MTPFDKPKRDPRLRPPTIMRSSSIKVLIGTQSPSELGNGRVKWPVMFKLSANAPADGWIIQEINVSHFTYAAKDQEVEGYIEKYDSNDAVTLEKRDHIHYYEAWPVPGNKDQVIWPSAMIMVRNHDDEYELPSEPNSRGLVKIDGLIKFYVGDLPKNFVRYNSATVAGPLPSTTVRPVFWTANGAETHSLHMRWDRTKGVCITFCNGQRQVKKFE